MPVPLRELFFKSSEALKKHAWMIKKFGFIDIESEDNDKVNVLREMVSELNEMSGQLKDLAIIMERKEDE